MLRPSPGPSVPCFSRNSRAAIGALAGLLAAAAVAAAAMAQQTEVPFGGLDHDSSQPVEITADVLELDQASGTAVFSGSVTVGQGDLRLTADTLTALYAEDSSSVDRMEATGNVTLVSGAEAAEAERAVYDLSLIHI